MNNIREVIIKNQMPKNTSEKICVNRSEKFTNEKFCVNRKEKKLKNGKKKKLIIKSHLLHCCRFLFSKFFELHQFGSHR